MRTKILWGGAFALQPALAGAGPRRADARLQGKRPAPRLCLFFLFLALTACQHEQPKSEITIAAAANLMQVFEQLGPKFEAQTGIHPRFSFGSTAQLSLQIQDSAPFDVFTAADSEHVADLDRKGLLTKGTRAVYARGVLALWFPRGGGLDDLASVKVRVIAIAKPDLAPYGAASVETLRKLGIWDRVQPKVVYAENISMAKQYGTSKNADAVFTAYSLVLHESGNVIPVDEKLHQPIDQELGIVAKSDRQEAAAKFTAYLLRGDGRAILASFGYNLP